MASSPQSYQKRQRELRKKERKAEKLAIRHGKSAAAKEAADDGQVVDEDALLEEFRLLNEKFAAGDVPEDDFEFRKAEIFAQLGLGEPPLGITHGHQTLVAGQGHEGTTGHRVPVNRGHHRSRKTEDLAQGGNQCTEQFFKLGAIGVPQAHQIEPGAEDVPLRGQHDTTGQIVPE